VTSAVAFSVALGVSTVALPLVALPAGYRPTAIGLLALSVIGLGPAIMVVALAIGAPTLVVRHLAGRGSGG
jgi:hypothetical protein